MYSAVTKIALRIGFPTMFTKKNVNRAATTGLMVLMAMPTRKRSEPVVRNNSKSPKRMIAKYLDTTGVNTADDKDSVAQ